MFRGAVNAVPAVVLVALVVVLVVTLVLAGVLLVRRWVPATREGFDAEVSSQILGVVASLFGLLLAFVVVLAFQSYTDAQDNVRQEADALAQIVRDSAAFGPDGQARVEAAVGTYVRAVVDDEWDRMRDGERSPEAVAAIDDLYAAMQSIEPSTPAAQAFYDDAVRRLNDALAARRSRIDDAAGGLSAAIAGLVVVGSMVILGYTLLVGSRRASFHVIGAAAVALVVGFALVVLLTYNYPFSGSQAVDPGPFREGVLARYFADG